MGEHTGAQARTDTGREAGPEAFAQKVAILCYTYPHFRWQRGIYSPLYCKSVCSLLGHGVDLAILTFWRFMKKNILLC